VAGRRLRRDGHRAVLPARRGQGAGAARQAVCAACPVRVECLRAELAAPVPCGSVGIVGGLAPWERTALRTAAGVVGYVPGRFLADRALSWRAHQHARRVGITQAAAELGTDTATLRRAFDRHGLEAVPAMPRQWRFATREQAAGAYGLAVRVGIMAAAQQLGSCNGRLREAFARFDLPWPPPPRPARASVINPHHGQRVEPVFFVLNPAVLVPVRLARQAGARVRRAEEFEVLGARVLHALGDENQARRAGRVHVVAQRARQAQQAAPPRRAVRRRDRDGQRGPTRPAGTGTAAGTERRRPWDRDGDQDRGRWAA